MQPTIDRDEHATTRDSRIPAMNHKDLRGCLTRRKAFWQIQGRVIADLPGHYLKLVCPRGISPREIGRLLRSCRKLTTTAYILSSDPLRKRSEVRGHASVIDKAPALLKWGLAITATFIRAGAIQIVVPLGRHLAGPINLCCSRLSNTCVYLPGQLALRVRTRMPSTIRACRENIINGSAAALRSFCAVRTMVTYHPCVLLP